MGTLSKHETLNPNFKILLLAKCFKHFICLKSDCVKFRIKNYSSLVFLKAKSIYIYVLKTAKYLKLK